MASCCKTGPFNGHTRVLKLIISSPSVSCSTHCVVVRSALQIVRELGSGFVSRQDDRLKLHREPPRIIYAVSVRPRGSRVDLSLRCSSSASLHTALQDGSPRCSCSLRSSHFVLTWRLDACAFSVSSFVMG
ncbi:unnamed protein product [Arctogadus glacialis]